MQPDEIAASATGVSFMPAGGLKGTGFSPYINPAKRVRALAPESLFTIFVPGMAGDSRQLYAAGPAGQ
jgi:hypothetical protein